MSFKMTLNKLISTGRYNNTQGITNIETKIKHKLLKLKNLKKIVFFSLAGSV